MVSIKEILLLMAQENASAMHLTAGTAPVLRVYGSLVPTELPMLTPDSSQRLIYSLLNEYQKRQFERDSQLDLAFGVRGWGRIRMSVFRQRGSVCAVLRATRERVMSFEELGLPSCLSDVLKLSRGLVLVTGRAGQGKSATLASMIDHISETRKAHIVTIERSIEYLHIHKRSIVNQRELGNDAPSLAAALEAVDRQDPDVVAVTELRNLETASAILNLAETGRLALSTLHTHDVVSSLERLLGLFPTDRRDQVRMLLSATLQAIICQSLVPHVSGDGRIVATELLIATPTVREVLREGDLGQLQGAMGRGGEVGMHTLDQSLRDLYVRGEIDAEAAVASSSDPEAMKGTLDVLDDRHEAAVAQAPVSADPFLKQDADGSPLAGVNADAMDSLLQGIELTG